MKGVFSAFFIAVFLAGAGMGVAYTLSEDVKKNIDKLLGYSTSEEVVEQKAPAKAQEAQKTNKESVPEKTATPKEPAPEPPPTVKKPSYLDYKHDPEKAPVPQPLREAIIKVPASVEQSIVRQYPFKQFPSLVDAVDQWKRIPGKILPLEIVATKEILFKLANSSDENVALTHEANKPMFATLQRGNMLIVSPHKSSKYEAMVPLFQTNIKEVVGNLYNRNVNAWFRHTLKLRNDARARYDAGMPAFAGGPSQSSTPQEPILAVSTPSKPATSTAMNTTTNLRQPSGTVDPAYGPMPRIDGKGAVMCAAADIQKGNLRDCQLQFVQRWGVPKKGTLKGRKMWVVEVGYQVDSIFGRFPQEARAYIRNEKVEKWEVLDD